MVKSTKLGISVLVAAPFLSVVVAGGAQASTEVCNWKTARDAANRGDYTAMCDCTQVTPSFLKRLQTRSDFATTLRNTSAQCPGLAALLTDQPTASIGFASNRGVDRSSDQIAQANLGGGNDGPGNGGGSDGPGNGGGSDGPGGGGGNDGPGDGGGSDGPGGGGGNDGSGDGGGSDGPGDGGGNDGPGDGEGNDGPGKGGGKGGDGKGGGKGGHGGGKGGDGKGGGKGGHGDGKGKGKGGKR